MHEGIADTSRRPERIACNRATTFIAVSTVYRQILKRSCATAAGEPNLRHCISAGDPLPTGVLAPWRERFLDPTTLTGVPVGAEGMLCVRRNDVVAEKRGGVIDAPGRGRGRIKCSVPRRARHRQAATTTLATLGIQLPLRVTAPP